MAAKKAAKKARGAKANRKIKNSVFCKLFGEIKYAIELVNALLGTNYAADAKAEITTLENILSGGIINDLAILLDDVLLVLFEHQSTVCGNLPYRMLEYATETYKRVMAGKDVYSEEQIQLPRSVFAVLYNGKKKMGARELKRLSDSYSKALPAFAGFGGLELEVTVINVNDPRNKKLVKTCKSLDGYCIFMKAVDRYKKTMSPEEAVCKAVDECIARGVLTEFLEKHRKEMASMMRRQRTWNDVVREAAKKAAREAAEKAAKKSRAEGRAEGLKKGQTEGLKKGRAEGIGIGVRNTALALKREGIPISVISRTTRLSASTIRRL